ncbi:hypothetical protein LQD23_16575 [Chromobacterium violaceum]|uniref:hypothetical protein n=1 Tax=Chromobacterium violaceum TaxID=536 RepID=UPI001E3B7402|nr:hypothetical protein [Chromobacterium violaceum]MCD0493898.1 hypothetical protein [Chromobacterium violaceum]
MEENQDRTLTDADVDAVLDRAFKRLRENVGSAVLGWAWKGLIIGILLLAYWGWKKGA